jgi:hypothetical protein
MRLNAEDLPAHALREVGAGVQVVPDGEPTAGEMVDGEPGFLGGRFAPARGSPSWDRETFSQRSGSPFRAGDTPYAWVLPGRNGFFPEELGCSGKSSSRPGRAGAVPGRAGRFPEGPAVSGKDWILPGTPPPLPTRDRL